MKTKNEAKQEMTNLENEKTNLLRMNKGADDLIDELTKVLIGKFEDYYQLAKSGSLKNESLFRSLNNSIEILQSISYHSGYLIEIISKAFIYSLEESGPSTTFNFSMLNNGITELIKRVQESADPSVEFCLEVWDIIIQSTSEDFFYLDPGCAGEEFSLILDEYVSDYNSKHSICRQIKTHEISKLKLGFMEFCYFAAAFSIMQKSKNSDSPENNYTIEKIENKKRKTTKKTDESYA